eukprot:TRINITY_DN210_c0_g1_i7.p1 TRINITY_DN210_c0_g1~~TRINITY_DN210_c0_g1_i7.p1  ORF type:complete len:531 (-),score=140.74 TRINITY_DN210_c0_g1_i7:263-1759(-)
MAASSLLPAAIRRSLALRLDGLPKNSDAFFGQAPAAALTFDSRSHEGRSSAAAGKVSAAAAHGGSSEFAVVAHKPQGGNGRLQTNGFAKAVEIQEVPAHAKLSKQKRGKSDDEQQSSSLPLAQGKPDDEAFRHLVVDGISEAGTECKRQIARIGLASDDVVIHDLRVALRRLRSTLRVYDRFLDLPSGAQVKYISGALRVLGAVRDADVMKETLDKAEDEMGEISPEEAAIFAASRREIAKLRAVLKKKAMKTLEKKTTQRLLSSLDEWVRNPEFSRSAKPVVKEKSRQLVPSLLMPHASEMLVHQGWQIESIFKESKPPKSMGAVDQEGEGKTSVVVVGVKTKTAEVMHDLRKHMRELRYRMELMSQPYEGRPQFLRSVERVKTLQGMLGELQDMQVLSAYLEGMEEEAKQKQQQKRRKNRRQEGGAYLSAAAISATLLNQQEKVWEHWRTEKKTIGSVKGANRLYRSLLLKKQQQGGRKDAPNSVSSSAVAGQRTK